MVLIIVIGVVS